MRSIIAVLLAIASVWCVASAVLCFVVGVVHSSWWAQVPLMPLSTAFHITIWPIGGLMFSWFLGAVLKEVTR